MPIPINLKQILQSDTQQEKLDKVNYNFDQLVANGGGPMGATGSIGETGFQGATGDDGPQGIDGPQGFQGPADASNNSKWKDGAIWYNGALNIKTIVPEHELAGPATQVNFPPTNVLLGYASNDDEYNDLNLISGYLNSVLLINKNSNYHDSNIRLISEKGTDKYLDIALTNYPALSSIGEQSVLEFKFASSVAAGEYRWNADTYIINDVNDNEMMSMDAINGVKFTGSFLSTNDAIFTGSIFKINNSYVGGTTNTNPDVDKIAVALDNTGTIGFKEASEIGASVPIGTIISFHYDTYIDVSNFTQNQTINLNSDPSTIDIVVGRGVAGTQYEGWYLCNGQTWKNSNINYTVPNLNSFSFNFTTNVGQITSLSGASRPNFIGGGLFTFSQDANSIEYDITVDSTEAWVSETSTNSNYATTEYAVVKTPQLIYLGASDLYYNVTGPAPLTFPAMYSKLLDNNSTTYNDAVFPNSPDEAGADRWREINLVDANGYQGNSIIVGQPLQSAGREIKNTTTGTWSAGSTSDVQLEYGQVNIFDLRLTARGKDTSWSSNPSPESPPNCNTEREAESYSWFTDWSERWNGNTSTTSAWNYVGEFNPSSTSSYYEGQIFSYQNNFYTVSPGQSSMGIDPVALNITDPSAHIVATGSSWEKGGNSWYGTPRYFYRLPKVEDPEEESWHYSPMNQSNSPSNSAPPPNNRFSLTLTGGRGGYGDWATNTSDGAIVRPISGSPGQFEPVWPSLYEQANSTTANALTSGELYDQQGRWTWPAEVFLDIYNDIGQTVAMVQVPIITRWNKGIIEDLYDSLTIDPTTDFPQYSMPYNYTEGTNHWNTAATIGTQVGPTISGPGGTIEKMYSGGWENPGTGVLSGEDCDYWYTGQNDTEFRRYQRVEFKILVSPSVSNDIYSYLDNNPGSTIKFRTAWWSDKIQDGTEDYLDPDTDNGIYNGGGSPDYSSSAWNRQPAGMGYDPSVCVQNYNPPTSALQIQGGSTFNLDDYSFGAGNGSDQVQYITNDATQTPIVISGTSQNTGNGTRYTATVNPPNINTGIGTIDIQSVTACSQLGMGYTTNDLVIQHSAGNSTQITYTGSLTTATCPSLCESHVVTAGTNSSSLYSYEDCNGVIQFDTILVNGPSQTFCAAIGSVIITTPSSGASVSLGGMLRCD